MCSLLHSPPFVWSICVRMWGRRVLPTALPAPFSTTLSPALSVYLCANVGPQGLLLPCSSHTPPVSVPTRPYKSSPPRLPISAPPTGLDVCFFFIYLVSDFLAVRFSVQFWLCEEAQCVYLCRHLGSQKVLITRKNCNYMKKLMFTRLIVVIIL